MPRFAGLANSGIVPVVLCIAHFLSLNSQTSMKRNLGFVKLTVLIAVLLCVSVLLANWWMADSESEQVGDNAITFTSFQGEFISSVNEVGDIESSSNVEIRCRVKSRGRTGTTILKLVPEGTKVEKGDFLCQLDDSLLREELTERRIQVARDKASVIQAEAQLDAAQRKLDEYENGNYAKELAELEAAISLAKERLKRAEQARQFSYELNMKGYTTATQLQADEFAAKTAQTDLDLALQNKEVYVQFTRERMLAELRSDIEQQQSELEASRYTLELSQQREIEYTLQVENCRLVAPQAGTVVYANENDRRDSAIVIEEGAEIRDGQPIFYLPDPTQMQVNAKVNDSKINKVEVGQKVHVRVDTDPETPIEGVVRRVSSFPLPRRYYQAPIEYEVFIDIVEDSPLIRGGLRGKVEIFVERQANVVQVPVSSLVLQQDEYFVLVKTDTGVEPRRVEVGSNNERFVIIKSGIEPGVDVLVDADNFRDQFDFTAS